MKLAKFVGALAIGWLGAYFGQTMLSEPWAIWLSGASTCFCVSLYWNAILR